MNDEHFMYDKSEKWTGKESLHYLIIWSSMLEILCSDNDGSNLCIISLRNWSLMPGLARSANSNEFFNSSIASILYDTSFL